ncbi:MAG: CHASE2 domain-containing protein [Aestuariibacter sp.]
MTLVRLLKEKSRAMVTGLVLSTFVLLVQFSPFESVRQIVERADGLIYDIRLNTTLNRRNSGFADVVIVDLDEKTMEEIGWPWPREDLGQLVYNLADAGAVVIGFDVIFAEPSRNPAKEVLEKIIESESPPAILNELVISMDGDRAFAESFDATDVLFAFLLQQDDTRRGVLPSHEIITDTPVTDKMLVENYSGYVSSLPMLHEASAGEGFMNSSPDPDGFLRRSALINRYQDKLFPSLSLEAARLYALADTIEVKTQPSGEFTSIDGVVIGNQLIPTDARGRVLIPYRGPQRSFPYVSAVDVLRNDFDHSLFESAIVLVGTSAVGLADLRATPVGLQYPGVEVHANVIDGLLQPEILKYRPEWWEGAVVVYIILMGLLLSLAMPLMGPMFMALTGAVALSGTVLGNVWLWNNVNISLPMASSLLLIITIMVYNIAKGFFSETKKRQQIKGIFDQYVPPAHIDKMLEEPDQVSMDGERKEMSVLFSDIRSFTSISEELSANELKQLLNRYFDPITESIFHHQGTIDKYVGDMVMAFWGAPLDDEKHAQHAVETSFDMLRITERLRNEFVKEGLPAVRIGIGINTGFMNVGDMGSTFRRAYTVLGDAVNLGSRLEGLTKFYGVEFLVSLSTMEQCEGVTFRRIDKVKVKGKNEAVAIFEPIMPEIINDTFSEELHQYHHAYDLYLNQKWDEAEGAFKTLNQKNPEDILYHVYLERIPTLREQTLPEDWDGSYTHTSK